MKKKPSFKIIIDNYHLLLTKIFKIKLILIKIKSKIKKLQGKNFKNIFKIYKLIKKIKKINKILAIIIKIR